VTEFKFPISTELKDISMSYENVLGRKSC
jgi:hypothetical protein